MTRIAAISSVPELQAELARLQSQGVRAMFGFGSGQDDKNSTQTIAQASQGGLGLPDRDYYTKQDERSKKLREQYQQHIVKHAAPGRATTPPWPRLRRAPCSRWKPNWPKPRKRASSAATRRPTTTR